MTMPESPKKPASRERLLSSAVELFIEKGFPAVSVRDIAGRAGLSTGLLYNYFDSKEHLLREIIHMSLQYLQPLYNAEKQKPSKFWDSWQELLASPDRRWTLYWILYSQALQVDMVKPIILDFRLQQKQYLVQSITRHTKDPLADAELLIAAMDGIVWNSLSHALFQPDMTLKRLARRFKD